MANELLERLRAGHVRIELDVNDGDPVASDPRVARESMATADGTFWATVYVRGETEWSEGHAIDRVLAQQFLASGATWIGVDVERP